VTAFPHYDIPEEDPRIFSRAAHNALGLFVDGPQLEQPWWLIRLIEVTDSEEQRNTAVLATLAADKTRDAKQKRRKALKAKRREELAALCAQIRTAARPA
jgi:hypothetical protein